MTNITEALTRGVFEIIKKENLEKKLKKGKKLRIKLGIDPTAPDIHLGHTVPLRKLKQFQDLGHQVVFIIGDFTATVGDPSARKEARKPLTEKEVEKNMKTYLKQVSKILDLKKTEIHKNSEWFHKKDPIEFFDLASKMTIQRILERDDFKKRLAQDRDINMLEVIYPLLQGYDSVMIKSDLEIGGTDQKFNLLMGRRIQKRYGQEPQDIMTLWLLEGIDGVKKMSKSFKNYIGIAEPADEMYGKIMSIPDDLIVKYFRLLTDIPDKEVDEIYKKFKGQADERFDARKEKARLAFEIVRIYHGREEAEKAQAEFEKVFKEKELPSKIKEAKIHGTWEIVDLLIVLDLVKSRSEAKRVVEQAGVKINGQTEMDRFAKIEVQDGMVIQVGKRNFVRIRTGKR